MMHFHHQRDIAVTQTLHQVHLPQRQRAIEQAPRHFADEFGELASATGRGKGRAVQVVVERKIGILQPVRIAEAQRTLDQATAKRRDQVNALPDIAAASRLDTRCISVASVPGAAAHRVRAVAVG